MLRREPTTIKLAPEDVKDFYREQTYNTISGSSNPLDGNSNSSDISASPGFGGLNQNLNGSSQSQQGQSIKERIIAMPESQIDSKPRRSTRASHRTVSYVEDSDDNDDIQEFSNDDVPFEEPSKKKRKLPRSQKKTTKRRQRKEPSNIDNIEDFKENHIFQALSSDDTAINDLASSWLEEFNEGNKHEALKDLVNFVLRSCGCTSQLEEHDVINAESAQETIAEVQILFENQTYHENPLAVTAKNSKRVEWVDFKKRALDFVDQLLRVANANGILYENDELVEMLLAWLGAISTSNLRPLRLASTLFCLQMETTLCRIVVNLTKSVDRFQRQLDTEEKKLEGLKGSKSRVSDKKIEAMKQKIAQMEENIVVYKEQKKYLETFLKDIFNSIFAHRYRDIDPTIRQECIRNLCSWINELPEFFFESIYIRYFGWLLTDQDASVRTEVLKQLLKLYRMPNIATALRQFTGHFKSKLIQMVIYETDFHARMNCLSVLTEIAKKGFLEDDESIKVTSLIFVDSEDLIYQRGGIKAAASKFKQELATFISVIENETYTAYIESHNAVIVSSEELVSLDLKEMILFRFMIQLLRQSYEYYETNYQSSKPKKLQENIKIEKIASASECLYSLPRYNKKNTSLELIVNYLLFDLSSITLLDSELKSQIELKFLDIMYLFNFLYGATKIYSEGSSNNLFRYLFPRSKSTQKNNDNEDLYIAQEQKDREFYLSHLIAKLPQLVENHKKNQGIAISIALTNCLLENDMFKSTNQLSAMNKVAALLIKTFKEADLNYIDPIADLSTYIQSVNYQYMKFFASLPTESMEINLKVEELNEECSKKMEAELSYDSIHPLTKAILLMNKNNSKLLKSVASLIKPICEKAETLVNQNDDPITTASMLFQFFTTFISETLEITISKFIVLSESDYDEIYALDLLSTLLSNLKPIIKSLIKFLSPIESPSKKINLQLIYAAATCYADIIGSVNYMKAYFDTPTYSHINSTISRFLEDEISTDASFSTQRLLLKVFLIKEYQLAQAKEVELDREVTEDVNFGHYKIVDEYKSDDDEQIMIRDLESSLCVFTVKLLMLYKVGVLDEEIYKRLSLNAGRLSELMVNLFNIANDTEKEQVVEKEASNSKKRTSTAAVLDDEVDENQLDFNNSDNDNEGDEEGIDPDQSLILEF
ncbi:hypothetical protein CANARDRAFT_10327 [[Candida] arabinofermentans NRRL YB-2248]|uniref:SCD domain-containing protein n=1 Tax=[Candida] arabinofermentans NRRL YB-2248 TaxID=983967 RepID=A0A1E4ST35_9ASCO|nr:hypothetical protein CANARDRAFT_10327 [[Candida] arabinofermentans NRRL YB-2248]